MLIAQMLKNALGCMALLFDQGLIGAQDLINNPNISIKGWPKGSSELRHPEESSCRNIFAIVMRSLLKYSAAARADIPSFKHAQLTRL